MPAKDSNHAGSNACVYIIEFNVLRYCYDCTYMYMYSDYNISDIFPWTPCNHYSTNPRIVIKMYAVGTIRLVLIAWVASLLLHPFHTFLDPEFHSPGFGEDHVILANDMKNLITGSK